ncbi:MAG: chemotaxis protein CheX [Sulfurospirillum sp.]
MLLLRGGLIMKPIIKNSVAIFHPSGFLDGNNAMTIITGIDENEILLKKPDAVFVSLKKIIFFNKKGMAYLVDRLTFLKDECTAFVGFCDYDHKKYSSILDMFADDISFSLLESEDVLFLFAGTKKIDSKSIIIYSDNHSQKNQLAMALIERKLDVKIAKDEIEFKKERKKFDFIVENSYIGNIEKKVSVFIKNNVIIYTLKGFIDSAITNTFDMKYHRNSIKVGFRIFCFDVSDVSSINIHGANFLSKLSIEGAEFGVSIVVCGLHSNKTTKILTQDLEDAGILLYDDLKSFFTDEEFLSRTGIEAQRIVKKVNIDKKIISILPSVIEATVHTVEVLSDKKPNKQNVKIQKLDLKQEDDFLISIVGIYRGIDAIFILAIDKKDATEVCKILLMDEFTQEELFDAFSEFTNVISGKIVQMLKSKHIDIEVTMPRIFDKISEVKKLESTNYGVQVDFKIQNKDMIIFLTR